MSKEILKRIAYWAVPAGIVDLMRELKTINPVKQALCRNNSKFKGIYRGKRCFIVCNGPSINKQDLMPLKNEIVFSVSSGYHHKDYLTIQPMYHCIPQFGCNKCLRPEDVVAWFKEMHSKIGSAELFLDLFQAPVIKKHGLFPGRKINYVYSGFSRKENITQIVDISRKIPSVSTAPVLCLMVAIYMGFKDIYLLGIDNDFWKTGEYKYFFEPTVLKGKEEHLYPDGKLKDPLYWQFLGFGTLLKQYWHMHNIARANNISIFNATEGGALEEFERVRFESLF